jgi:class 3 adenylate cyclase
MPFVPPDTRYAKSADVNIAYQVAGDGPLDLVLVPGFISHLELDWQGPGYAQMLDRLSSFARVIRFDKRGTGLSDRPGGLPDLESRMDDVRAVMDAAGTKRAALMGYSEGGPLSMLFAATYPERTTSLVLYGAYAKRRDPATVLFTDIVGSTTRAVELGDRRWHSLLEQHHATVRHELGRFRGNEVDTAGDGFLATFDGPARAVRCAQAIRSSLRPLGIDITAGVHSGEVEVGAEGSIAGLAVHIGARVAAQAQSGEVLASSTVKDLVAGSGLEFDDRGIHKLKGVPGEWRLYAVRQ